MKRILALALCVPALFAQGPRRAPSFCLPDMSLQFRDLLDYRGKIVVLEFMKTDCSHCAPFGDVLKEVQAKYEGRVQVLAIANTNTDKPTTAAAYIKGHQINYPMLWDMGQVAFSYIRQQSINDLPHIYIINPAGYIANDFGYSLITREIFEGRGLFKEIDRMLAVGGGSAPQK
jgi:peroxiredoxin